MRLEEPNALRDRKDKSLNYARYEESPSQKKNYPCTKTHSTCEQRCCLRSQDTPLGVKIQCVGGQFFWRVRHTL